MTLDEALQQGDYQSAISILQTDLKQSPNPGKQFMLVELKGYVEDFDGALRELEELERQRPGNGYFDEFSHVLNNGKVWCSHQSIPGFGHQRGSVGSAPPEYSMRHAEAIRLHVTGAFEAAQLQLELAKSQAAKVPGELQFADGESLSFTNVRDADELTGPHLVCSHPQSLLDIPFASIAELEFYPGRGFQDTLWKPTRIRTWDGSEVLVRVYSYYVGSGCHESQYVRQFRLTQCDYDRGYAVAIGQRDFHFSVEGSDGRTCAVGIHRIKRIVFRQDRPS